jgi:hypothetical protein
LVAFGISTFNLPVGLTLATMTYDDLGRRITREGIKGDKYI